MENSLDNFIKDARSLTILLPTRPFFDQVAAGLALYLSLKENKQAFISSPSPLTVEFNRLVGVNKIGRELGNKNLVISLKDYDAKSVERVSADIIDGRFQLTVVPKPSVAPPEKDQLELSYSGIESDLVFLIGGSGENHFPPLGTNELAGAKLIHLGVKPLNLTSDKKVITFARPASSVSEIVASIILFSSVSSQRSGLVQDTTSSPAGATGSLVLNSDIATNLLMGIEEATKSFSSPGTTADTFQIVAELIRAGGKRRTPGPALHKGFPPGSIPSRPLTNVRSVQAVKKTVQGKSHEGTKEKVSADKVPQNWLNRPKVYKGTSIN